MKIVNTFFCIVLILTLLAGCASIIVNEIIIAVKFILWHIHFKEVDYAKKLAGQECKSG